MYWDPLNSVYSGKILCWNDGRGLLGSHINPNYISGGIFTNTYEISQDMNELEIRYRILLPYQSITINDLFYKTYNENFSKEYRIVVDLSNVFTQNWSRYDN